MEIKAFSEIQKEYIDFYKKMKEMQLEMASPRFLADGGHSWLIKDTFMNEFGMYLIMIAMTDKQVDETEMEFIRELCHFHVDKYMVEQIGKELDFFGEGTFLKEVPLSLMAIVDIDAELVVDCLGLYIDAGIALAKADDGPYVREFKYLKDYLVMIEDYIYKFADNSTALKCRMMLENADLEEKVSEEVDKRLNLYNVKDYKESFDNIYRQCNIPPQDIKGYDIQKLLKKDFREYILYLSLLDGKVSDDDKDIFNELTGLEMSVEELEAFANDCGMNVEEYGQTVPMSYKLLMNLENEQNKMKIVMKGRLLDYSTHPCRSIMALYKEIAIEIGSKSEKSSDNEIERYLEYHEMLKKYDGINVDI